jgi:autotransporter translocation and assembly factor TamB
LEAGSVELTAELEGPWRRPVGQLDFSGVGLERAGERIDELTFAARTDGDVVELPALVARSRELELDAAGRVVLDRDGALVIGVERARLSAGADDLALTSALEIVAATDGVRFDRAEAAGSAGRVSVALELAGERLDVSATFEDCRPSALSRRWIPDSFRLGSADGSVALSRRSGELTLDCDLALARIGWADLPAADLALRGRLAGGHAKIEALSLSSPGWQVDVHGSAPFDPLARNLLPDGPIDLEGEARWDDLRLPDGAPLDLEGALGCSFELSGGWGDLRGSFDFNGATASADAALTGQVLLGDGLVLDRLRLETPTLQVEADGRASVSTDLRAWIADSSAWRRAGLDLNARASSPNLEFLAGWLPGLRRTGGSLEGQIAIGGSAERPDWRGSIDLRDVELRAHSGAGLDGCGGRLRFEGTRLIVEDLSGQYGAGPFRAKGWLELDPRAPSVDLEVRGEEILLARRGGVRLRADCDLRIVGAPERLAASGTVALRDGRYTRDVDFFAKGGAGRRSRGLELFSLREAHLAKMTFDINVTAQSPFRVENNVVKGALRPDLRLTGTGAAPELIGTVFLDPTRVSLPATKLELTSGTVEFGGGSPLLPTIEIFGQTRMRGFDVRMHATGPYNDARVTFSSVPPLSEEQLRVLVLTGQTPEQALSAQGGQVAARNVAVFLGRDLISSWFGSDKVDEGVLSRIEIKTAKEVSRTGVEASEVTFRMSGNPQRVGRSLYLRAESDIYERINFGLRILFRLK